MKTVLIVDYDPRRIDRLRRCVRALGGVSYLATDGEAGEKEFHRLRPDLTVIEDIIPKKRGFQLCADLKSTGAGGELPVVLMADLRNGRRYRVGFSRCDDFLAEPFDEATLVSKVGKLLRAGARGPRPDDA